MSYLDSIAKLEDWVCGHKARSVFEISKPNGYGASCWEVVLCGRGKPPEDWAKSRRGFNDGHRYVFAYEIQFLEHDGPAPPNVVCVLTDDNDDEWPDERPGLAATIDAAVKLAVELGL